MKLKASRIVACPSFGWGAKNSLVCEFSRGLTLVETGAESHNGYMKTPLLLILISVLLGFAQSFHEPILSHVLLAESAIGIVFAKIASRVKTERRCTIWKCERFWCQRTVPGLVFEDW